MGKISRSNYEVYFLDYIDGNLSVNQIDDFLDFLETNPDLVDELKSIDDFKIPDEIIVFQGKENLQRNASYFDFRSIAYLEGDLSETEQNLFLTEINIDLEKQSNFDLMLSVRLKPDTTISYPNKKELFKTNYTKKLITWLSRAAAAIILSVAIWSLFPVNKTKPISQPLVITDRPTTKSSMETESRVQLMEKQAEPKQTNTNIHTPFPIKTKSVPELNSEKPQENSWQISIERELTPDPLTPKEASLEMLADQNPPVPMKLTLGKQEEADHIKPVEYLVKKIHNVTKGEIFRFSDLAKAGLIAIENISNDRFVVKTNVQGKIAEINFHSQLVAFSIPIKKNK